MKNYVVKLWDKCDKKWYSIGGPFTKEEANNFWNGKTLDGTVNSKPSQGDYYKIFKLKSNITISKLK